jgi:hypothetical protein
MLIIYFLTGLGLFASALKFIFAKSFFPYHEQAVGMPWEEIDPRLQYMILVLMKVIGVCLTAISLFILFATIQLYYKKEFYLSVMIISGITIVFSGLFIITYMVYRKTRAKTPWIAAIIWLLANMFTFILTTLHS